MIKDKTYRSYLIVFILGICFSMSAQVSNLDKVFLIGEHQKEFNHLIEEYDVHLLAVCDNSMDEAYKNWTYMLHDLELFSKDRGFDIRGVKLWMNALWSKEGKIDHLVFYPKPNSKNTNYDILESIMEDFVEEYEFPLKHETAFSHYGSASFPTFVNYKHFQAR